MLLNAKVELIQFLSVPKLEYRCSGLILLVLSVLAPGKEKFRSICSVKKFAYLIHTVITPPFRFLCV
jgi:hypothetical protein